MSSIILPRDELVEREDVLILDTETTGRGQYAEIIEIAMIDTTGNERYRSLCKPERPIPITAMRVHKITDRMVADAKMWVDIHETVKKLFEKADYVLAWNADFDQRMLRKTANRYGLQWKTKYKLHDLFREYRELRSDRLGHSLQAVSYTHLTLPTIYSV